MVLPNGHPAAGFRVRFDIVGEHNADADPQPVVIRAFLRGAAGEFHAAGVLDIEVAAAGQAERGETGQLARFEVAGAMCAPAIDQDAAAHFGPDIQVAPVGLEGFGVHGWSWEGAAAVRRAGST